jgi:glycopeptide antibiotics resistance protein
MISFISQFSTSFLIALIAWPFVALLLTLPVLLVQYIRFKHLPKARVGVIYFFMLYVLALIAFTLYPMPDDLIEFCASHHLMPQLIPGKFILDIQAEGLRAVLQVAMNVVLFAPLGIFARNLFGVRLRTTLIGAFLASLLIETVQLTGGFGFYPCSYRLFDVDDLIFNVLGAALGFWLARCLPDLSRPKKPVSVNTNPKLTHRTVTFVADYAMAEGVAALAMLPISLAGADWQPWYWLSRLVCFVGLQFVVPFYCKGQTVFGSLTGISLDNKKRTPLWRLLYYLLRTGLVLLVVFLRGDLGILIAALVWLYWLLFRKMPYELVDRLFEPKPKSKNQPDKDEA